MIRPALQTLACIAFLVVTSPSQPRELQTQLRVKKSTSVLEVLKGDSVVKSFLVAVGKNPGNKKQRGDMRTPEGVFTIVQIQDARSWKHDFGDGKGVISGAYGPWFLRLDTGRPRWTGIGIHGTHDPASLGTMATEGCIRVRNDQLEELRGMVGIGTVVTILP